MLLNCWCVFDSFLPTSGIAFIFPNRVLMMMLVLLLMLLGLQPDNLEFSSQFIRTATLCCSFLDAADDDDDDDEISYRMVLKLGSSECVRMVSCESELFLGMMCVEHGFGYSVEYRVENREQCVDRTKYTHLEVCYSNQIGMLVFGMNGMRYMGNVYIAEQQIYVVVGNCVYILEQSIRFTHLHTEQHIQKTCFYAFMKGRVYLLG